VNLFDDTLLLPTPFEKNIHFPKKNFEICKKILGNGMFCKLFVHKKKRTKNFTVQSVG